jgi:hypothetical protein
MSKIIKIGLKSNANFLFAQMKGDTEGGTGRDVLFASILHVTEMQFKKFKKLISTFDGDVEKSLVISNNKDVDYECYFVK